MENYAYNSYPDSGDSSPRSREIEFENPPPWEDQSQQQYKAKFMCSYGGKIILGLMIISDVSFKYQLPGEDLDSLISVSNDDDLEHMMHEYDRLFRALAKPARMRLFVFPVTGSVNFGSEGSKLDCERFVEAFNSGPTSGGEKNAAIPQNKVDFLFGLEKGMAPPPPVKIRDPVAEPVIQSPPPPPVPEVGDGSCFESGEIQRQIQALQRLQIRDQEQLAMYRKKLMTSPLLCLTPENTTLRNYLKTTTGDRTTESTGDGWILAG
ncbi:Octicosapeptide/Phox/Bem1p family protein, putative isoform 2 [Hibiscus syriacus]|uniref:Octicosapeptide/Phox/Bem1p family protein, putative isoform 2 n=1 Tax=Hibiscus syriacus TaxID=106335 RepID=A0A6A2WLZ4_HIBSY|nr:Octicosapeptide/Phox/Bem1p family protein, putative isoform 2 [Hibiscus syriacus]